MVVVVGWVKMGVCGVVQSRVLIVRRSMVECIGATSSVALINVGRGNAHALA